MLLSLYNYYLKRIYNYKRLYFKILEQIYPEMSEIKEERLQFSNALSNEINLENGKRVPKENVKQNSCRQLVAVNNFITLSKLIIILAH